jgi:predicted DNA-binding transcriptional regulator YafY
VSVHHIDYGARTRFVASCHKAKELRWFRVSRVRDARLDDGESFVAAADADVAALLARSVDGWTENVAPRDVTFVVYGEDARWVPGNLPSPEMKVATCEGGIRVRATTSALTVIARFVVGLGGAAMVESPELAERVEELARGAMARARRRVRAEPGERPAGSGAASGGVVKAWNGAGRQAAKAIRAR